MTPKEYVESSNHLPLPIRDFHDAKDVFKLMHRRFGEQQDGINFRSGMIYTIDWFLWFMAQRGWTLQRSRAKVDFFDLNQEIEKMKEEIREEFQLIMNGKNL